MGVALKSDREALKGNVEALNGDREALKRTLRSNCNALKGDEPAPVKIIEKNDRSNAVLSFKRPERRSYSKTEYCHRSERRSFITRRWNGCSWHLNVERSCSQLNRRTAQRENSVLIITK